MEVRLSQRARWGAGQPISELMSRALENPDVISLAAGFVDNDTLPVEITGEAWETLWKDQVRSRRSLQYGSTVGLPSLREQILDRFVAQEEREGASHVSLDQIVLTAGSNQLLHLVASALLDPGDIVLTAAPTYFVFLGVVGELGARSVGVESDDDGMIPEALDETFRRLAREGLLPQIKLVYVIPYFDNPTGATLPPDRRAALVEIVRRWSRHHLISLVADDAYRELRYSGNEYPSMRSADPRGETVIEAGTFSKSFSPGIRVGWGVLPKALVEPILHLKGNLDFGSAQLNQQLMEQVLHSGAWEGHLEVLRASYRVKLEAMLGALEKHLGDLEGVHWRKPEAGDPAGGLYVWLRLPESVDTGLESKLWHAALREGVFYVPGHFCYPLEGAPIDRRAMRLSFGVQSPAGIERGIQALGRAVREVLEEERSGTGPGTGPGTRPVTRNREQG